MLTPVSPTGSRGCSGGGHTGAPSRSTRNATRGRRRTSSRRRGGTASPAGRSTAGARRAGPGLAVTVPVVAPGGRRRPLAAGGGADALAGGPASRSRTGTGPSVPQPGHDGRGEHEAHDPDHQAERGPTIPLGQRAGGRGAGAGHDATRPPLLSLVERQERQQDRQVEQRGETGRAARRAPRGAAPGPCRPRGTARPAAARRRSRRHRPARSSVGSRPDRKQRQAARHDLPLGAPPSGSTTGRTRTPARA